MCQIWKHVTCQMCQMSCVRSSKQMVPCPSAMKVYIQVGDGGDGFCLRIQGEFQQQKLLGKRKGKLTCQIHPLTKLECNGVLPNRASFPSGTKYPFACFSSYSNWGFQRYSHINTAFAIVTGDCWCVSVWNLYIGMGLYVTWMKRILMLYIVS